MLPVLLLAAATAKLPPANPVPLDGSAEAAVMAPVNALFKAIAARDANAVAAVGLPEGGGATIAMENPDGTRTITHRTWAETSARFQPGPERFEERLTDPAIEIDGDIAMVWGAYSFWINGNIHHCGVDHFDLVRKDGNWKIANVTWSQRTLGCKAAQ